MDSAMVVFKGSQADFQMILQRVDTVENTLVKRLLPKLIP